jgi:hypothetical protein
MVAKLAVCKGRSNVLAQKRSSSEDQETKIFSMTKAGYKPLKEL